MEKFTKEECAEIIKKLKVQSENLFRDRIENFKTLDKNMKEHYVLLEEGINLVINDPNSLFDNLEKKHHYMPMFLFQSVYGGDFNDINIDKCKPAMIKLINYMVELGLISKHSTDTNIN